MDFDAVEFGRYLREKRKEAGLTLVALGSASKVSQPYLSQLENGKGSSPSTDILLKLSSPLGVDYLELASKAGYSDVNVVRSQQVSYAASVIIEKILEITDSIKNRYLHMGSYISYIEEFENKLEMISSKAEFSIPSLISMLKTIEADGDSYESLIGTRNEASQIEGLLRALGEVIEEHVELDIRRISSKALAEITLYLKHQEPILYNGHPFTDLDKQRILDMLKALFPEYQQPYEDSQNE